ncbi:MAG TPA: hypothetical protein VIZ87_07865 [Terrimicrobium sp.]
MTFALVSSKIDRSGTARITDSASVNGAAWHAPSGMPGTVHGIASSRGSVWSGLLIPFAYGSNVEFGHEAPRSGVWNPFVAKQLGGDQRCAKSPYCYTSDLDLTTSMLPRVALEYGTQLVRRDDKQEFIGFHADIEEQQRTGIEFRGRSN